MVIAAKDQTKIVYGTMSKIAVHIGVHRVTIKRWIESGDRIVYKNGFEIFLNVEKL
ncbi:MAG: hypothetical protein WD512_16070 [Candidatus Paceibacterota bacterium]